MTYISQQKYLGSLKVIFKNSKEYINHYNINNEIFESFGFEDTSWHNDLCPSYSKNSDDEKTLITIWFPNSENEDYDNEEFNTFSIDFQWGDEYLFLSSIDEVFSLLKSNEEELNHFLNSTN